MKDSTAKTIGAFGATSILTYGGLQYYAMQQAGQRNYLDHMRYTFLSFWDPSAQPIVDSFRVQIGELSFLSTDGLLIAAALGAAAGVAVWGKVSGKDKSKVESFKIKHNKNETHLRGAKMLSSEQVAWDVKKSKAALGPVVLGGVPLTQDSLYTHYFIAGTTGAGKSVLFFTFLDTEEKTARAFVVDNAAGFLKRYFNPGRGDIILNPLDARSAQWSPFAEINEIEDCAQIACSLVPDEEGPNAAWAGYAQTFLKCLMQVLHESGSATNGEFYRLATKALPEELQALLGDTEAAPMLHKSAEKMFGSARAIASSHLRGFDSFDGHVGADGFSLKKFCTETAENKGWLFMPYQDGGQLQLLKGLISCWTDIAILAAMSKESKQRKYFVLDEFDSIGKVGSVRDTLLSKGRKYGATALIAVQTLSQVRERYGREGAAAILGNCGSWISFRTTDVEMSEEISKRIGEAEIERVTTNKSANKTRGKNRTASEGQTQQTQVVKTRLVMPEELRQLAKCEGFLMTSEGRVCPIHLDYPSARAARTDAFVRKSKMVERDNINPSETDFE
jgi:hypothetical protein